VKKVKSVKVKGKKYDVYKSSRKNKQRMVKVDDKWIHYGDPKMKEYPGTKRGDSYCARSFGLGKKFGVLEDPTSPNFWSRKDLWNCINKKSKRREVL